MVYKLLNRLTSFDDWMRTHGKKFHDSAVTGKYFDKDICSMDMYELVAVIGHQHSQNEKAKLEVRRLLDRAKQPIVERRGKCRF